uniref:Peptidase A1 domain-containing protein n=1 Tax=Oryza glaberrima TaxID=4538 RepID=I1QYA5_ORYGL
MAAARWAPIAGFLLVLPALLLLPPAASSAAMVFPLHGNVFPSGRFFLTMNIGVPAKPYFLDIDTGSDLTWVECDAPCQSCHQACMHALLLTPNALHLSFL